MLAGSDIEGVPQSAALSPDGTRLAIDVFPLNRGKSGIPIYILSTETGELEKVVIGAREVPSALDLSPARDLLTDDYGLVAMCSSLGREDSLESPATKAGFFTLGLAEGFNGKADFNKDGVVYIHELDVYATLRVAQLSGGGQTPTTGPPPTIRPFPITVS